MKKEKVYISAPFRRLSTDVENRFYGIFDDPDYKQFLEKVDSKLRELGFETCLPHRDEGQWGEVYIQPEDVAEICFKHIETSILVVVFPDKSRGVHVEIGYAAGLRKRILVFLAEGERESTLIDGLAKITNCRCVRYQSKEDVLRLLDVYLGK